MNTHLMQEWILNKLKENPKLFGGDKGNPAIMRAYLIDKERGKKVEDLTDEIFSKLSKVSRMKNLLLEIYKEYDYRTDKVKNNDRSSTLYDEVA